MLDFGLTCFKTLVAVVIGSFVVIIVWVVAFIVVVAVGVVVVVVYDVCVVVLYLTQWWQLDGREVIPVAPTVAVNCGSLLQVAIVPLKSVHSLPAIPSCRRYLPIRVHHLSFKRGLLKKQICATSLHGHYF